jgi:LPXTG-motif cell wall-anchored protein
MKKLVIGATAAMLSLIGFSGMANAYPPDSTTTTTDVDTEPPGPTTTVRQIPRTGGDVDSSLMVGASAVALGAGMVLVTRRRRRPLHD